MPPLVFPQSDVRGMSAKNSLLMTHHYPDLGSAPDWLCRFKQVSLMALGSDVSSVWNFCTCFMDFIFGFLSKLKLAVLRAYLTVMGKSLFLVGGGGGGMFVDIFFCKIKSSMTFSPKRKEA